MPEVEGEYCGSFGVDFSNWSDAAKYELIESIVQGRTADLEGSAYVTLEFDFSDYAPDYP